MPTGVQLGLGVRPAAVSITMAQGALAQTGGVLDVAIEGRGWLEVTLPSGLAAYTRDGALQRTGDGLMVTADGFEVSPGITIPEDARQVSINADGEVYAYFADRVEGEMLGRIHPLSAFPTTHGA